MTCELCSTVGGRLLWEDNRCRAVLIDEPGYTGYCRVIWKAHVAEMTDLADADRTHCMRVVLATESALRELLLPHKVNLASLGNFTPHLHWHVIPRFRDDPHFPQAIWGSHQREAPSHTTTPVDLRDKIAQQLAVRLSNEGKF
ncbi:MAG: HIT family protein [Burkholderiales bacterium]